MCRQRQVPDIPRGEAQSDDSIAHIMTLFAHNQDGKSLGTGAFLEVVPDKIFGEL